MSRPGGGCATGIFWVKGAKHSTVHRTPPANNGPAQSVSSAKTEKAWPRFSHLKAKKKLVQTAELPRAPAA